jgi:hypothetical protein
MTKKHFIALADAIRDHNKQSPEKVRFNQDHLDTLAGVFTIQNPRFMPLRWLGYIAGTNGKNGGKI